MPARELEVAARASWELERGGVGYPEALEELDEHRGVGRSPQRLWGIGRRELVAAMAKESAVTIIGTRRPTRYGTEIAEQLGFELASAGLVVVSGMAMGIDSAAHRGALEADGDAIAVLAGGPDQPWPPSERRLHASLAEHGAIVAEHRPGTTPPGPWAFRERNRIMAALSAATIVVEATERSGSLITARISLELSRRICCVPGRIGARQSEGPNGLIRDGAELIRGAADFLDGAAGIGRTTLRRSGGELDPELERILDAVESGASTPDRIVGEASGGGELTAAVAAVALVRLELMGYVACDAGGRYERTSLAPPEPEAA